jgi:hypothetical protein
MTDDVATPPCPTCNGRGIVSGFVNATSGYQDDPCPDCRHAAQSSDDDQVAYWREQYHEAKDALDAAMRTVRADEAMASQLSRSMSLNARYATALQRIRSLEPETSMGEAWKIANEALKPE